jgi:cobalamin-dependent methionine synthase I
MEWKSLRDKIIGLGEASTRKSYYPELQRRLAELKESEARFRTIYDSVNDAISVHDASTGEIVDVNQRLRELFGYVNETALFKNQWQLKTASQADYKRLVETKFRPILERLKEEVIAAGTFEPKVVYGWFPCQSEGDALIIYRPEDLTREWTRFTFPRQKENPQRCISDFFLPKSSGKMDVFGSFIVTVGTKARSASDNAPATKGPPLRASACSQASKMRAASARSASVIARRSG